MTMTRRLGAYEYLRKPVDISELITIIRRAGQAHASHTKETAS